MGAEGAGKIDLSWTHAEGGEPLAVQDIRDALIARNDGVFLITNRHGEIRGEESGSYGLYREDTRYLSRYCVTLEAVAPLYLLSSAARGFGMDQVLTNPAMESSTGEILPAGSLQLRRRRVLFEGFSEEMEVTNFGQDAVDLHLVWEIGADFRDIFEVRGMTRKQRPAPSVERSERELLFAYAGLDGMARETRVQFSEPLSTVDVDRVGVRVCLQPGESKQIETRITVVGRRKHVPFEEIAERVARKHAASILRRTRVETTHEGFNYVLRRSFDDLQLLWTDRSQVGPYLAAGVPWFDAVFGRDSLITGFAMLPYRSDIAERSLRLLAEYRGTAEHPERHEQPGKLPHELRWGEMARTGEVPFGRYYGSVDVTPLFVWLLYEYWLWTNDTQLVEELWPVVLGALEWIEEHGRKDPTGFLNYDTAGSNGLRNQGWKDSDDGIVREDGRLLDGKIALVEVQGYVLAARRGAASLASALGHGALAQELQVKSHQQRQAIEKLFRTVGGYGLALENGTDLSAARASNQAHLLWAEAASADGARDVASTVFSGELYSGWGVRTLSSESPRYNPIGYHTGSIWPHDNAVVAAGLRRYGFHAELQRLATALFEAALLFEDYRMPELFSGDRRLEGAPPAPYPVACRPQAWAAATMPWVVTSLLGLRPNAPQRQLYIVHPCLPPWLESLRIRDLRLGEARLDLQYSRLGERTTVELTDLHGDASVVLTANWPE